jgi:hypothetical protein
MAHAATGAPQPQTVMMQLLFGKQVSYSLSGVARLGVADYMDTTARPVDAIAAKAGACAFPLPGHAHAREPRRL